MTVNHCHSAYNPTHSFTINAMFLSVETRRLNPDLRRATDPLFCTQTPEASTNCLYPVTQAPPSTLCSTAPNSPLLRLLQRHGQCRQHICCAYRGDTRCLEAGECAGTGDQVPDRKTGGAGHLSDHVCRQESTSTDSTLPYRLTLGNLLYNRPSATSPAGSDIPPPERM